MDNDMQFVSCNGITIHYEYLKHDTSKPTLVFINPLGTDLRVWNDVIPYFSENYDILRYDKRGHGLSDAPDMPYSHDVFTQDLMALLDLLKLETVILIGASIGGQIAINTAINHPDRILSLVVCDTAAKLGTVAYWNERIEAVRTKGLDGMAETILSRWFAPDYAEKHPLDYAGYRNLLVGQDVTGYTSSCMALRDGDLRDTINQIQQATLVLCGAEDNATPSELVRELANTLPNAEFDLIPDAGHTLSVEQPELLAQRTNKFLKAQGYG